MMESLTLTGFILTLCGWLLMVHALFVPRGWPGVFNVRKPFYKYKKTLLVGLVLVIAGIVLCIMGAQI